MDAAFFTRNRATLRSKLKANSFVALAGFGAMQCDNDQPFAFKQEGNFWYLTGIEEPDWQLLLNVDTGDEWLIAPTLSRYQQTFDGGLSAANATKISGIKNVLDRQQGRTVLKKLLAGKKHAYVIEPKTPKLYGFQPNAAPRKVYAAAKSSERIDLRLTLAKMRAIKQPAEIAAIQKAVDITVDGLLALLPELKHYKNECEADAKLYYEFRKRGAVHGFDPIVASGAKTCILHAPAANDPLRNWLLTDVGARLNNYTADITRTVPLTVPTDRQRAVYEAVERAHDHFETLVKPGTSVKEVLTDAYTFMGEEMIKLGLIDKPLLDNSHIFKYMPHAITHGLGVDVHDPLGQPQTFEQNMVLTNEVGIYIPEEGFGVRIENDMVITATGVKNMAAKLPISLDVLAKMV